MMSKVMFLSMDIMNLFKMRMFSRYLSVTLTAGNPRQPQICRCFSVTLTAGNPRQPQICRCLSVTLTAGNPRHPQM